MMTEVHAWTVHPIGFWSEFKEDWDALNLRLSASPLLCSRFVSTCLAHFGTGTEQLVVCRRTDGQVVAAAIGLSLGPGRWSVLQISQAPLGFWLSEPEASMEGLINSLARALGPSILVLSVPQLDPAINPTPAQSSRLRIDPYIETARVLVDRDWELYWSERGKNLKTNHRKARKRAADSGMEIQLNASADPAAVASAVAVYGLIEERSWKAEGGTAVSPSNNQGRFYATLLSELARLGQARVYTLLVGGEPAAVDLCVTGPDCLVILKTTYSTEFKELSPASLLKEMYMAEVFREPNIERIEYYGPVMEWHLRWTRDTRTIYHATCYKHPVMKWVHELLKHHVQKLASI